MQLSGLINNARLLLLSLLSHYHSCKNQTVNTVIERRGEESKGKEGKGRGEECFQWQPYFLLTFIPWSGRTCYLCSLFVSVPYAWTTGCDRLLKKWQATITWLSDGFQLLQYFEKYTHIVHHLTRSRGKEEPRRQKKNNRKFQMI